MGSKISPCLVMVAVTMAIQSAAVVAQTTHTVGDSLGWIVPPGGPIAYSTWAATQTFMVGDILVFTFNTGEQDVAMVSKEAFDSCNSTNPISLKTAGPANFTLGTVGDYYFIGTMDRHCPLGQKLAIKVIGSSGHSPSPSPSTRSPITYTVGDGMGWLVPPLGEVAYSTWAYNKKFMVGDTLVFNFINGTQDVAVVTKEAFQACNTSTTIALYTSSPTTITLTTVGMHYFTSTYEHHCDLGQQLSISVIASSGPALPPPPQRSPVTYTVGDDLGWIVPPLGEVAYSAWAYNKIFIVGDTLVFNFVNGTQDVAVVTKEAYDTCNTSNTIAVYTTSPTTVTLTTSGMHYFTSTYARHCGLGQKLAINVLARSTAPSPSGAPTPSSSSAMPPSSDEASSPTAPPPSSSAPSQLVAGALTFLSIAVAFLH